MLKFDFPSLRKTLTKKPNKAFFTEVFLGCCEQGGYREVCTEFAGLSTKKSSKQHQERHRQISTITVGVTSGMGSPHSTSGCYLRPLQMVLKQLFCSQETCSTHPNTLIPLASSEIYRLMQRKRKQIKREETNKSDNIKVSKNPKKKEFLKGGGSSYLGGNE